MTSQHDKPKRWRPRFSVRTLVIVVTLVCCYAACWRMTKLVSIPRVDNLEFYSAHHQDVPYGNTHRGNTTSPCPFFVRAEWTANAYFLPDGTFKLRSVPKCQHYYLCLGTATTMMWPMRCRVPNDEYERGERRIEELLKEVTTTQPD
jgi:hypothetical protein